MCTDRRDFLKASAGVAGAALLGGRVAFAGSHDAEVRRRARTLLGSLQTGLEDQQVAAIVRSNVSAKEKGRRLKMILRPGMKMDRVRKLLGSPQDQVEYKEDGKIAAVYRDYGVTVLFAHAVVEKVYQNIVIIEH